MHLSKFHSTVVFCHNDLQEGNILTKNDGINSDNARTSNDSYEYHNTSSLIIIDYEYCAYNYRSYDIANHFIEWKFDYTKSEFPYFAVLPENYPTLEQQVFFFY